MATVSISNDETDETAIKAAKWALHRVGAKRRGGSWGVGGSQEIASEEWKWLWASLTLEGETYIGLTFSGPDWLVNRVARLAAKRLRER